MTENNRCRVKWACAGLRNMLCQRARNPPRSRPRRCAWPFSLISDTRFKPSFLRTTPARNPRTECCCHSVAVMREARVAPAGVRSIAMMRSCLVLNRAAGFDEAGAGRLRDADLPVFRAVERDVTFGLDLGLVMGSSEVRAAPSAAPPQPHPGKSPGRAGPRSRPSAAPDHPQQRSVPTRKPVNSEQDHCSLDSEIGTQWRSRLAEGGR